MSPDLGMLIDSLRPDCDSSLAVSATCGGVNCPEPNFLAAALCEVPCCAVQNGEQVCGTRNSTVGAVTECEATPPPATPDARCPAAAAGGLDLEGCCSEAGQCGVIWPFSGACLTESAQLSLPQPPQPCEGWTQPDGGLYPPDAGGNLPDDAGTVQMDSGTVDAGSTVDAGMLDDDAGL